jgi:hypothetical protein
MGLRIGWKKHILFRLSPHIPPELKEGESVAKKFMVEDDLTHQ